MPAHGGPYAGGVLLLAFDTATPAVTVALHDGERVLAESTGSTPAGTASCWCPPIDRVLADARAARSATSPASSSASAPARTPGCGSAWSPPRAFGDALGIPVHGVCTLDGLAYAAGAAGLTGPFAVATDARRKEVYWARYDGRRRPRSTEPAVDRPAELADRRRRRCPRSAPGAALYPEAFPTPPRPRAPVGRRARPRSPPTGWPRARPSLPAAAALPAPPGRRRCPPSYKAVLPA